MKKNVLFFAVAAVMLNASCVSQKKYSAAVFRGDSLEALNRDCQKVANSSQENLNSINASLKNKLAEMAKDTASQSLRMHQLQFGQRTAA